MMELLGSLSTRACKNSEFHGMYSIRTNCCVGKHYKCLMMMVSSECRIYWMLNFGLPLIIAQCIRVLGIYPESDQGSIHPVHAYIQQQQLLDGHMQYIPDHRVCVWMWLALEWRGWMWYKYHTGNWQRWLERPNETQHPLSFCWQGIIAFVCTFEMGREYISFGFHSNWPVIFISLQPLW